MRRAIAAIVARDLKRMLRQRGRLVSSMVRPLMWLFVIGTGFQGMLEGLGRGGYQRFLVPGLLSMVVLFGSLLASLSMIYDKESGVMRMLIVAPIPRPVILLARTLAAALIGITQALMLFLILLALGYAAVPPDPLLFALGLLAQALVCASLGTLIAVCSKALEDFAVIMNFVIFPVFFLSGALYPLERLPAALKAVALANPFSYGVDVLKHALGSEGLFGADLSVPMDLLGMLVFILLALAIASWRFSQAPVFESLARVFTATKKR
jgi:ABC-2 type transport system permease protein